MSAGHLLQMVFRSRPLATGKKAGKFRARHIYGLASAVGELIASDRAKCVTYLYAVEKSTFSLPYMALIHSQQFLPPCFQQFLPDVA